VAQLGLDAVTRTTATAGTERSGSPKRLPSWVRTVYSAVLSPGLSMRQNGIPVRR